MKFFRNSLRHLFGLALASVLSCIVTLPALSEPVHGISMHGEPALPADYKHLPYVNPDAPKGGQITHGIQGTFDSVNPFILKSMRTSGRGSWDAEFGHLVFESLLFRSRDEPFTMYGLLAEKVEWPEDRSWIEFTMNPNARWSDGVPVTVDDVVFTYELLTEKGRPPYNSRMKKIEKIEITGERKVRFVFNENADREFPMIIALNPVLPKHAINVEDFDKGTLEPMVGSGPYFMTDIKPGKKITFTRNPDYWAKDLPSRVGFSNFDKVHIEFFRSANTRFEAFKKGLFDVYPEGDPANWQRDFSFPAVQSGDVVKDENLTGKPAPMLAFVFNTRREIFKNREIRRALAMLFDFEWLNKNLYFNAYTRTASFWHGSELSSANRPASELERELLGEYVSQVQPDILEGKWAPPKSNASGNDRKLMRTAFNILKENGIKRKDGKLVLPNGKPLSFEILARSEGHQKMGIAYKRTLGKLGISVEVRRVDDAQYQQRVQQFDYDMTIRTYTASLSPGIEQIWRWGSRSRDLEGTFNFVGTASPALDAAIDHLLNVREKEQFVDAVRAYDRLLLSGHYVIPLYHIPEQWVARRKYIGRPEKNALYGYRMETWWDERAR